MQLVRTLQPSQPVSCQHIPPGKQRTETYTFEEAAILFVINGLNRNFDSCSVLMAAKFEESMTLHIVDNTALNSTKS